MICQYFPKFSNDYTKMQKSKMKKIENDELNDYLECTCGRCDDGKCQCRDWEQEFPPAALIFDDEQTDWYDDLD